MSEVREAQDGMCNQHIDSFMQFACACARRMKQVYWSSVSATEKRPGNGALDVDVVNSRLKESHRR